MHLSKKSYLKKAELIFTHKGHDYLQRREQGTVYGTKSIVTTCLVNMLLKKSRVSLRSLSEATVEAMSRCLRLYTWGYPEWVEGAGEWEKAIWKQTESLKDLKDRLENGDEPKSTGEALLKTLQGMDAGQPTRLPLNLAAVRDGPNTWSITRQVLVLWKQNPAKLVKEISNDDLKEKAGEMAAVIAGKPVEHGKPALKDDEIFPRLGLRVLQVGKLTALERTDVDNVCSVQRLLRHYLDDRKWETPMSFGVFGAPGSGKSFAVKELTLSLKDQFADRILEFNVAQWTALRDMATAFHAIRDVRLGGRVPVVFFDEFDADFESRRFGWLKYFLMPMQDGRFQDDDGQHDIGRAVLVFAGGINHRFGEFSSRIRDRDFCEAKGPDFLSRLRGFYDVPSLSLEGDGWGLAMLRRAWILRSKKFRLSDEVRDALLQVKSFRHGARSMTAILDMSNENRFTGLIDRSSLPRRDQLGIHVDYEEFMSLVEGNPAK